MIKPDGGNPFSGDDWYKPSVTIGYDTDSKSDADQKFDMIAGVVNGNVEPPSDIDLSPVLEMVNFFIGKYTDVLFRIRHEDDNTYRFSIEVIAKKDSDKYAYFDILSGLGFQISTLEDTDRRYWTYRTSDISQLNKIIEKASDLLINNFSLKIPTNPEDTDSFTAKAHLIRNRSIDEFYEWLAEEDKKRQAMYDEMRKNKK